MRPSKFNYLNNFALRAVILLMGVALLSGFMVLERIDAVLYDKISVINRLSPGDNIVIVSIDEESLSVLGRWPWSRRVHAELIDRLAQAGSNVVAFDLLFSEQQDNDSLADNLLAQAIKNHGSVILPVAPVADASWKSVHLIKPISILAENARLGHVDIELDSDGVARRAFLAAGVAEPSWPAFGLATLPGQLGQEGSDDSTVVDNDIIEIRGEWVRSREVLIPYVGPPGSYKQIPYAQVLFDNKVLPSLSDKIVIVGVTAAGMGTRFATPVSQVNRQPMTGVEWHANVIDMLQNDQAVYSASNILVTLISLLWVSLVLIGIGLFRKNLTIPILFIVLSIGFVFSMVLLRLAHVWVPPSAALLGTVAIYPLWNWQRINGFIHSWFVDKVRSSAALESVEDGVITTDAQDKIIYLNKGAERILQTTSNQVKGNRLQDVLKLSAAEGNDNGQQDKLSLLYSESDIDVAVQCSLKTLFGDKHIVRMTRHQLRDENSDLMGFVIAIADITDTVELVQKICHQETHDTLTKLPNRKELLARFDQLIKSVVQTGTDGRVLTVFFVALDNFKKVNDAMGHRAGDQLLRMMSRRLSEVIDHDDIVARWGDDEFVLLFNDLPKGESTSEMAQKILAVMEQKFVIQGMEVFVSVSIGISFYPDDGCSGELVVEHAGSTMHHFKEKGGNRFGFYSSKSTVIWTRDRLELEKELRAAVNDHQLQVFFQPIFDANLNCAARMEALIRWPHPKRGFLSPGVFIPLAEDIGLINQLGKLVLRDACIVARKMAQGGMPINVSVNVSPHQILYGDFVQVVLQVLSETEFQAESLILEVTESAIIIDMDRTSKVLQELKNLGVLIALDDFGTGYSSLTLLRELPIDIIKIDQSFVRTLDQNQHDLTIVKAIIGLGKSMGLVVIAEGVETEQQVQILIDHDCHYQQGFYFSRPLSYELLVEFAFEKTCKVSINDFN